MRRTVVVAAVAAAFALVATTAQAGDRWYRGHGYGAPPPWAHGHGKGWKHRGGDWYGGPRYVIVEPRRHWHAPLPRRPPPGITITIPFPYR